MYMVRIRPTFSSGKPISTYWSDAKYWAGNARDGYTVDHNATVGSIMQTTTGYYGHVAYVERVNAMVVS